MLRPRLWSPLMQGSVDRHMLAACLCHPEESGSLACFGEQRSSHLRRPAQTAERAPSPFAPSAVPASGQACHLPACRTQSRLSKQSKCCLSDLSHTVSVSLQFVLTLFIFKAPNYVLARTLTPVAGPILRGGNLSPILQGRFCKLYPADFSVAIYLFVCS